MMAQSFGFIAIMVMAGVITSCLAVYVWLRRTSPGGFPFVFLMAAVALIAFTGVGEFMSETVQGKIFWSKLSYLGIVNVSPLWLLFAIDYSGHKAWLTRRRISAAWAIPLLTLGLAFTNEHHRLIWSSVIPVLDASFFWVIYGHGPVWWIHAGYAYLLMFAGTYGLIRAARHTSRLHPPRVFLLVTAALIPWLGNFVYLLNLSPFPGQDLTPLAFGFSGLILVWNIYRFKIFDLMPVAREAVFNSIKDCVLVIDTQNQLVDANPTAFEWFGMSKDLIGIDIREVLPQVVVQPSDATVTSIQIEVGKEEKRRIWDVTISPLLNNQGRLQGSVALFHDMTQEHMRLDEERLHSRQMELLNTITQSALGKSTLQDMLQDLADQLGGLFAADGAYLTLWDAERQQTIPAAAYGSLRDAYPKIISQPDEQTITTSVLDREQVLVIEDVHNTRYVSPRIASLFPTNSIMALPLIADREKLGAAIISFHQIHSFTDEEIKLGKQAAAQISLAVYKTQLYEKVFHRSSQFAALQSVSQAVTSSLELAQIFRTVVEVLSEVFRYTYVSIFRLEGDVLRLSAQVGYPAELPLKEIPVTHGVLGRAYRTRQPQFVRDVSKDPDFIAGTEGIHSEICVPLIKDQGFFGMLSVESSIPFSLTETDLMLLIAVANQIAIAIENAQLYKAERDQRAFSEALRSMGMALSESLDLETVLDRLLDEIQRVIPYDRGCVILLNEAHDRARITRMRGEAQFGTQGDRSIVTLEFKITTTANLRRMIDSGLPGCIPDTRNDPDWKRVPNSVLVRSWVGAPIILHGAVIGFLSLDKLVPGFYCRAHAQTLSAFANQAAIAIENARIFTDMMAQADKERILFAATLDFSAGLNIEELLHAIMRHMRHALGVKGCKVVRWDSAENRLVNLFDVHSDPEIKTDNYGKEYNPVDYPTILFAIQHRKYAIVHNRDPAVFSSELTWLRRYQTEAMLILPLIIGRRQSVFGAIGVYRSAEDRDFSGNDLEIAQSLTLQAAIALENALLYAETQQQAIVDELTGLYNRRGFFRLGTIEFERATRCRHPLSALFMDIDFFKQVNDTYGYPTGDQVLRLLAKCLQNNLRGFDLTGRYGGEEFVVLLPETDIHPSLEIAEGIRQAVSHLRVNTGERQIGISVSIGIAERTHKIASLEQLIDSAGQKLHQAKNSGRNRIAST